MKNENPDYDPFIATEGRSVTINIWFQPDAGLDLDAGKILLIELEAVMERGRERHSPGSAWWNDGSVLLVVNGNKATRSLPLIAAHLKECGLIDKVEIAIPDGKNFKFYAVGPKAIHFERHFIAARNPQWRREHWDGTPMTPEERLAQAWRKFRSALRGFCRLLVHRIGGRKP